jgi:hypothetical protein
MKRIDGIEKEYWNIGKMGIPTFHHSNKTSTFETAKFP